MKKKSNDKNNFSNLPFSNGIRGAKYEFIKMIDSMTDDEFMIFIIAIMDILDTFTMNNNDFDNED